jgi:hypothetical protein
MRKVLCSLIPLVLGVGACAAPPPDLSTSTTAIVNGVGIDTWEVKAIVSLPGGTGTFVHPYFILTAAHLTRPCVGPGDTGCWVGNGADAIKGGDGWYGRDGLYNLNAFDGWSALDPNSGRYSVTQVYYPRFGELNANEDAPDIALLRVSTPFRGQVIRVMGAPSLPTPANLCDAFEGSRARMAGFSGNPPANGADTTTRVRRWGEAEVECDLEVNERAFMLDGHGRDFVGVRACRGDSGGPVLWGPPGALSLGGVISYANYWNFPFNNDCPSDRGETGAAFIPRTLLERAAQADPICAGRSWDACVAAMGPAAPPIAPGFIEAGGDVDGIKVRWTDAYGQGTTRIRISRVPAFPDGTREIPVQLGARREYVDTWGTTNRTWRSTPSYGYTVCAVTTLEEQACDTVTYRPQHAAPPTNLGGVAGPQLDRVILSYSAADNGQMVPEVRVYRLDRWGYDPAPFGASQTFEDRRDVYAYHNYRYAVCTVSRDGEEACAGVTVDTYGGTPQCPRNKILCDGACRFPYECEFWQ